MDHGIRRRQCCVMFASDTQRFPTGLLFVVFCIRCSIYGRALDRASYNIALVLKYELAYAKFVIIIIVQIHHLPTFGGSFTF